MTGLFLKQNKKLETEQRWTRKKELYCHLA